jgi:hypothetical protein
MQSLRIISNPAKVTYYLGEPLNLAGLKAAGVWPGIGEEEVSVTVADITGYNASLGKQTLTITKNGKATAFQVTVAAVPVTRGDFNGTWENGMSGDWYGCFTISATEIFEKVGGITIGDRAVTNTIAITSGEVNMFMIYTKK